MSDKVLIDTNIWIYLYAPEPQDKHERARQLVHDDFERIVVTSQVLGELYHVLTRKGFQAPEIAKATVNETAAAFAVKEIGIEHVQKAIDLNLTYGYAYWDSLIIAAAILHDCGILYSEDMQHDQLIEGKLRIVNPFLAISG